MRETCARLCTIELLTTTTAEDIFSSVDFGFSGPKLARVRCSHDRRCRFHDRKSSEGREENPQERSECNTEPSGGPGSRRCGEPHGRLKDVIRVVNDVKPLRFCFQKLCQGLGSERVQGLYHAEVLKGKVLSRCYELRAEIAAFLAQNNLPFVDLFSGTCRAGL